MDKHLWGFLTLILGIGITTFTMYFMCVKQGADALYDTSLTCINEPLFWILIVIGIIIGIIGAYIYQSSN